MRLRLATRASALAQAQCAIVEAGLRSAHPDLRIERILVQTRGDRDAHTAIRRLGIGVFTHALDQEVLSGRVDLAVHSLKDQPTELPDGLVVAAVPPREEACDALLGGRDLEALPHGARVGTSSLRRSALLRALRPDLVPAEIRGNVDTRVRQWRRGDYDTVVLAEAGLRRSLPDTPRRALGLQSFPCAPGQGALAVTARAGSPAAALAARIDHPASRSEVEAEREVLARVGGGCLSPFGCSARLDGASLRVHAAIAAPDGSRVVRCRARIRPGDRGALARLAQGLLDGGGEELLRLARDA